MLQSAHGASHTAFATIGGLAQLALIKGLSSVVRCQICRQTSWHSLHLGEPAAGSTNMGGGQRSQSGAARCGHSHDHSHDHSKEGELSLQQRRGTGAQHAEEEDLEVLERQALGKCVVLFCRAVMCTAMRSVAFCGAVLCLVRCFDCSSGSATV
jgi:hypothetical protein